MDVLMDWKSVGSLYASLMFMRTAVRDIVPPEVKQVAKVAFNYFFSKIEKKIITIHIQDYENSADNDIFRSVQLYLSTKLFQSSSKSLRLSKFLNSKFHRYTMVPNQSIVDTYDGIDFIWTYCTGEDNGREKKLGCFFKLCFEEKHKEFVDSTYLLHIAKEADVVKFKNRGKKLFTNRSGDSWSQVCQFSHPSTFDTIAMDPVIKKEIQEDLKKFVSRSEFYNRVGKAWKRGYLLYGPPGTGKTSLIAAIANYLDFDIYDMELTAVRSNAQLRRLLISTTSKSVIVVEDIDCSLDLSNRKKKKKNVKESKASTDFGSSSVSLSGVLNFVDGLWSPCAGERLIIFTTNHKEKLDPALLRSGRMDKHILLSYCNMESFKVLAKNYLQIEEHELMKEVEELLRLIKITPADVAECLMSFDEDPDMGMRNVVEVLNKRLKIEREKETKKRLLLDNDKEDEKEKKKLKLTEDDGKEVLKSTSALIKQEEDVEEEDESEDEEEIEDEDEDDSENESDDQDDLRFMIEE
ncbi:hypothetical protein MKW94_000454 [Papaver nudicaule]|uniref:AAA+ ATPase domain-containing protein n=1 Tax=Papaver nudicaule TaxID=74823 RepID=A0AA41RWR3_PAPNU|nr:hypothetical protein [Papaver nudicaule]